MIIDVILDATDACVKQPKLTMEDLHDIYEYALDLKIFSLQEALDEGTEQEIKQELARYIVNFGYPFQLVKKLENLQIELDD